MGGMFDKADESVTTNERVVDVPGYIKSLMKAGAGVAEGGINKLGDFLGGAGPEDVVAPFSADTLEGFQRTRDNADNTTAANTLEETARGDFLFGGPGFMEAIDAATRGQQPGLLSMFGGGGRGVGSAALDFGKTQIFADAFANRHGQERSNQLNAALNLPGIMQQGANSLMDIGGQQQNQDQRMRTAPIDIAQLMMSADQGLPFAQSFGSTETLTQPVEDTTGQTIAGIAMAGLGAMSGNPFMAAQGLSQGLGAFSGAGGGSRSTGFNAGEFEGRNVGF